MNMIFSQLHVVQASAGMSATAELLVFSFLTDREILPVLCFEVLAVVSLFWVRPYYGQTYLCLCVYRNPSSLRSGVSSLDSGSYMSRSQIGMHSRGLDDRSSTESSSLPPLSTQSDPISSRRKLRLRQTNQQYALLKTLLIIYLIRTLNVGSAPFETLPSL